MCLLCGFQEEEALCRSVVNFGHRGQILKSFSQVLPKFILSLGVKNFLRNT